MKIGLDELTGTERAVLLVLLAEARPVRNPELVKLGPELKKNQRERLNDKGLIESVQVNRVWVHELTDDGWAFCRRLFGADSPEGATGPGKTLYTLMRGLDLYFKKADLPLADVFGQSDEVEVSTESPGPVDAVTADPLPSDEKLVHDVYGRLAPRPGGWVALIRLRAELPDVSPAELDATLRRMYRKPGVHLIPEENQKVLTDDDRRSAVMIGDQNKHLIAIEA